MPLLHGPYTQDGIAYGEHLAFLKPKGEQDFFTDTCIQSVEKASDGNFIKQFAGPRI
jgi:hypothetical protein